LIGAGPIGLEMAVALKEAGIDYLHLEGGQIGHTISWFPRQARFFSSPERIAICGVPLLTIDQSKASREEYLTYLLTVARLFELPIRTYERVVKIERDGDSSGPFTVSTERSDGPHTYRARRIILAIGDMHRPRRLTHPTLPAVPGADLPHVSHYFDEPHPYVGQQLMIVGGRNSAVEAAVRCHRAGAHVSLSYRRSAVDASVKYWLKPEIEWLIESQAIHFYPETVPVEITPTHVHLAPTHDGHPKEGAAPAAVPADFVLLLIGYQMDSRLLEMAGVQLEGPQRRPVLDPDTNQTNVNGLYVIGTAAAGTQLRFKLFIENCHCHVVRVLRHLAGRDPTHINPLAYSRLHEHPLAAES
jgi:thioredoxin reductase (NADPH)